MTGTTAAQSSWLPAFNALKMQAFAGDHLTLAKASEVFDIEGKLQDAKVKAQLESFMRGFLDFVRTHPRS